MTTTDIGRPLADFATLFATPTGSPIRELFPYLSRPGMISLAGGYPSPSLLDGDGLAQAASQAMLRGAASLQYGATEGQASLRAALAEQAVARGIQAQASDVLVTTGSQQALDLVVRVLLEPGDTVYVEVPAYPATLQALRLAKAHIVPLPMDEQGLCTDVLAQQLAALPTGQRPKLLYTVPNFSNPRGTLLSLQRRQHLVALALEYGFWVVEDDPYGELRFPPPQGSQPAMPASLRAIAGTRSASHGHSPNPVIYLSSLSKTVAPALRIGWMLADAPMLRRCAIAKQTSDLCTSPLAQNVADSYLRSGRYAATVAHACQQYQRRMQALVQGIQALPGTPLRCSTPDGGLFVWAQISPDLDPARLFDAAVAQGVLYVPGKAFYPDESTADPHTLRMSFAAPDVPDITEAVQRLARAIAAAA